MKEDLVSLFTIFPLKRSKKDFFNIQFSIKGGLEHIFFSLAHQTRLTSDTLSYHKKDRLHRVKQVTDSFGLQSLQFEDHNSSVF